MKTKQLIIKGTVKDVRLIIARLRKKFGGNTKLGSLIDQYSDDGVLVLC